jgi:flagellar protein FliS
MIRKVLLWTIQYDYIARRNADLSPSGSNPYFEQQIATLPKEKLALMLYDGEIKFLKKALEAIANNNAQEAHYYIIRAQDIMLGLMSGVNKAVGQIAENLFNLYEYMHSRLIEANITKDDSIIKEVLSMITDLRNAWEQMIKAS